MITTELTTDEPRINIVRRSGFATRDDKEDGKREVETT